MAKDLEAEENLKEQLQNQLDNKEGRMNRCTYNDVRRNSIKDQ